MDTTVFALAAQSAGVLPSAVEDAVRRLAGHFAAQADPTPDLLSQQLTLLRETAPHLFPGSQALDASGVPAGMVPEVWRTMAPSSKLAWAREHGYALPVAPRRPAPLGVSSEQMATLAALGPVARLTAYRALQAQQQQP